MQPMLSLLVLAVPAPDDAVHAEATPRGLNFATVPNEPVPERMTYTGSRWERVFGTPKRASSSAPNEDDGYWRRARAL